MYWTLYAFMSFVADMLVVSLFIRSHLVLILYSYVPQVILKLFTYSNWKIWLKCKSREVWKEWVYILFDVNTIKLIVGIKKSHRDCWDISVIMVEKLWLNLRAIGHQLQIWWISGDRSQSLVCRYCPDRETCALWPTFKKFREYWLLPLTDICIFMTSTLMKAETAL